LTDIVVAEDPWKLARENAKGEKRGNFEITLSSMEEYYKSLDSIEDTTKNPNEINVGDVYWDCSYHPVYCTELEEDDDGVCGISLFDASTPRSCSIRHCGIRKLNIEQILWLIEHKDEILNAEKIFIESKNFDKTGYQGVLEKIKESNIF
jgi:hypothetical protein